VRGEKGFGVYITGTGKRRGLLCKDVGGGGPGEERVTRGRLQHIRGLLVVSVVGVLLLPVVTGRDRGRYFVCLVVLTWRLSL
jgi:hypothetical protein